ncbi:MAG: adenylate/guanylate cyclase domain-containing protein [Pseudomonadota bacterium]
MSIRVKIIISLFFATMLITGGTAGFSYWLLEKSLFEDFRSRLENIVHIGAATIDIPATKRLIAHLETSLSDARTAGIEHSSDYLKIDGKLQTIRNAEPQLIQYAYILIPAKDPDKSLFLVDSDVLKLTSRQLPGGNTPQEISHFGREYDISKQAFIKQAFATRTVTVEDALIDDPVFHTRSLSAYAPLFDEQGRMLGILGVDLKNENMQAALHHSKTVFAAIILSSLALALILSAFLGDQLTKGILLLNQVVTRFAQKQFEVRAPVISNDEIGNLGKSFNSMAQVIDEHAKYLEALLRAYGRFVPHSFLEFLKKDSIIDLQLGDHVQQEMTVMFADIRAFTTLSETMTPQENFAFINAFFHRVGPVIRNHGGVIDKYIGDAVMALFPASPDNAVAAAIDMQRKVAEYNKERLENGWIPIAIGVGLHTGNLILGTVGEAERMNSTVIADAVNLASRLEDATKQYGVGILVSEKTMARLSESPEFTVRFLDTIQVKGKQESVAVFQVLDASTGSVCQLQQKNDLPQWQEAMALYSAGRFQEALPAFQGILSRNPGDRPARIYVERIMHHAAAGRGFPAES